ncbi:MAG: FAD-dependent oxidoreductase [Polaromonas sp.]|nr:FAD-dependent oxidoreductase [Polaromonas sp.]
MKPLIVIGAGLAGWTTVREFRKLDTNTPVMMITADSGDFYAKPSLSNAFAQGKAPAALVNMPAAKMVETLNITLMQRARVNAIHPLSQTVSTSQGDFEYSQLVLATGAQPIRVPLEGNAASRVLSVNSLDDFAAFHSQLSPGAHVLIMGAGLIGCEFANDLAGAGYQVSVVDPSTRPLAALLPQAAGEELQQSLSGLNVNWHFASTVKSVDQTTPGTGHLQVLLSDGRVLLADHVLSAIGLRADMALASAAGLACERGIVVDTALLTSSARVYALGDCAQYASAGARTLPYVMPIMSAARALAATLTGNRTELVFPLMPVTIKTPALPVVVAAPAPGLAGQWQSSEAGVWQFADDEGHQRGFVLTGKLTSKRAEQSKLVIL